jgi:AAA family ATP:ADP antiporter
MSTVKSTSSVKKSYFFSILNLLFPIKREDAKKVCILFCLFFLVSFVYNILQPLKKTIIMYSPGAGSEALPYLKPFAVAPGAFLVTWYFLSLARRFNRDAVFRIIILTFTTYFLLYTFILIPFRDYLTLDSTADFMMKVLPSHFHAGPALIRYWMHTLFYAFAELWGTTVLTLLLWGLVNEISTHTQAKATYALFTVGANFSGMFAGKISSYLTKLPYNPHFFYGHNQWDQAFLRIMLVVLAVCSSILILYAYFVHCGYTAAVAHNPRKQTVEGQGEQHVSIVDCFYQVMRSKNLLYLTIIVMGYNLVYNLSDVIFNKRVELSFGPENKVGSNDFLSMVLTYTSIVSTVFALLISNISLRYAGWTVTALMTPIVYILSGSFFYLAQLNGLHGLFPVMPLDLIALYAGAAHMCLTRGAKYSVFDSTKEMAYIGLTKAERVNGKAAIDGIASRFGKSGGSFILFFLYAILGNNIVLTIPYVFFIICIITILWMIAITNLGRHQTSQAIEAHNKSC